MKDEKKWTITKEPATFEGIEYHKIVYRDENGQIVQVIDDPPCMIGNDIADILLIFSGGGLFKNLLKNISIKGGNKDFGKFIMDFIGKYFTKKNANKLNNNPFSDGELLEQTLSELKKEFPKTKESEKILKSINEQIKKIQKQIEDIIKEENKNKNNTHIDFKASIAGVTVPGFFHKAEGSGCKPPSDPIILDLNNDGFLETTNIRNGIYFDHENDGFAEASAWVGENDGILFSDNNNNDSLDNGSELITADNLAQFDTNSDGVIDANDDNFGNLKIIKGDGSILTLED